MGKHQKEKVERAESKDKIDISSEAEEMLKTQSVESSASEVGQDVEKEKHHTPSGDAECKKEEACDKCKKTEPSCDEKKGDAKASCDAKKDDIEELKAEVEKWKSEYVRKVADFDNYRKRMIKEKRDAIDYANENLLVDLIQVLDDFDRAIEAVMSYGDEKVRSYMEGFGMIRGQFYSMLQNKYGLSYYKSEGEKFDPNIHEAKATRESDEVEVEMVEKELLKGYKLHNRVVRVAQVEIVKPQKDANASTK